MLMPHSGVLRGQKLKTYLLRTQSSKVLPSKPGVGQYIAMHATPTARNFVLSKFCLPGPFTFIPPPQKKKLSRVFPVLAVANVGSIVGLQNEIGHPAHRRRRLVQVLPC